MLLKKSLLLMTSAIALSTAAIAAPAKHMIIAPQCLLDTAQVSYSPLASKHGFKLIAIEKNEIEKLAEAKHHTKLPCGGFNDVTRAWGSDHSLSQHPETFLTSYVHPSTTNPAASGKKKPAYQIRFQKETEALLKTVNPDQMWANLTALTSMKDRYADSKSGIKAAKWIKQQVELMAKQYGRDDVTVYFVKTESYRQPSVVAKFGKSNEAGIVIGGHMDTLNSNYENKPGADDDGSGSVTVMETARTILASGMHFQKPIYFIWYSAEEMGLVGSDRVVADFEKKHIPVAAAMQLDMTGYAYNNDPTMWLMTDYVDKNLTAFLEKLINTYVKQPVDHSSCGYACSDHASWNKAGIVAAFPFESSMGNDDPYIHTANDKMNVL
jgi:leucyl aminopeptidase